MLLVIWSILYANWIVRWYFDWTSTERVDREWTNLKSDNNNNERGLPEHREKKAACVVWNNPLLTLIFHRRLILRLCAHQFGLLSFFFTSLYLCVPHYHFSITTDAHRQLCVHQNTHFPLPERYLLYWWRWIFKSIKRKYTELCDERVWVYVCVEK